MIILENDGLISKRSITTFGVSSKENESAIGYFGTGLKYAIAILLRENIDITIYIGEEKLIFTKETETVRVDDFDIVCMNGEKLGFTTELGKTWTLWQAFRELYCNCTDENGRIFKSMRAKTSPDKTVVAVEGKEFTRIFDNKKDYFLDSDAIYHTDYLEVHAGSSSVVFYKGVRVLELEKPSLFTYNITSPIDLTEDRTIKSIYQIKSKMSELALTCTDTEMVEALCTAGKDRYEHDIDYDWCYTPSDAFMSVVGGLHKEFSGSVNRSALNKFTQLYKHNTEPVISEITTIQEAQLSKAVSFCALIGHDVSTYPIVITDFMGEGILGMAKNGRIYITTRVFMMGTKYLAATILEEYFHLHFKLHDETRDMQNFLFDVIMTVGEEFALKEPI
jgi:hypothetical protein